MNFGNSKADTLEKLSKSAEGFNVLPMARLSSFEWSEDPDRCIAVISEHIGLADLIVRSSAVGEDATNSSAAGMYRSVQSVTGSEEVRRAVDSVFASYGRTNPADEVLVQPMARDVIISGVAMTADPLSGLPYFIVNFTEGEETDLVTAGRTANKILIYVAGHDNLVPATMRPLTQALYTLQRLVEELSIDVEFAISDGGQVTIFQVRPITTTNKISPVGENLKSELSFVATEINDVTTFTHKQGFTEATFGVMPDWNPAELVGLKPRPLAYSLYKEFITNEAWATGRRRLGYRDARSLPLMHLFGGTPFINLATSFYSFVPASVTSTTALAVVDSAQRNLKAHPELHDKVEFQVMPTCYTHLLHKPEWRHKFSDVSSSEWSEYCASLLALTNHAVTETAGDISRRFDRLMQRVQGRRGASGSSLLEMWSVWTEARIYGTDLFGEVARLAFIATNIVQALQQEPGLPSNLLDVVTQSSQAITTRLLQDFQVMAKPDFLARHGHIRPGTYDIRVPRYDSPEADYFSWSAARPSRTRAKQETNAQVLTSDDVTRIDRALQKLGYGFSWSSLELFARRSVRQREDVKYLFSSLISDGLEVLARFGEDFGFSREDLSFLTYQDLELFINAGAGSIARLRDRHEENRAAWQRTELIRLPDFLCSANEVYSFMTTRSRPVFITQEVTEGPVSRDLGALRPGSVVFLQHADPGYDWIFTKDIRGFVTQYGGENSHMAIRARELNMPAVIGCGSIFEQWASAERVRLDCATERVQALI